jgi:hypothetical protein
MADPLIRGEGVGMLLTFRGAGGVELHRALDPPHIPRTGDYVIIESEEGQPPVSCNVTGVIYYFKSGLISEVAISCRPYTFDG